MSHLAAYIPARAAPADTQGWMLRLRRELLGSVPSALATVLLLALGAWGLWVFVEWGLLNAVWRADAEQCQAARGLGACWGVVTEKHRIILFGRYPHDAHWRPLLASSLLVATLVLSCLRRCWRPWLLAWWLGVLALCFGLMRGGVAGLASVPGLKLFRPARRMTSSICAWVMLTMLLSPEPRTYVPIPPNHPPDTIYRRVYV